MKAIICKVCGYAALNSAAPDRCPVCGAPKTSFEEQGDALKTAADEKAIGEKHIPVILVNKKCGLIPDGCVDVNVKVGSAVHPMEQKHYIAFIDFYLDSEFSARVHLTPEKTNPAAGIHLKAAGAKVQVVESCTVHGRWFAEAAL